MKTKIQKWGNSLAVRIPKSCVEEAQVAYGTAVELSVDQGKIVIAPIKQPKFKLAELLEKITPGNLHTEIDSGDAVGREEF